MMRAAIFIDGAYLLRRLHDARRTPDWQRLAAYFLSPLGEKAAGSGTATIDLMRVYFYDCAPWSADPPSEEDVRRLAAHSRFVGTLEALNRWQVRLGRLSRRRDGDKEIFEQKRVDVQLSVDMVKHCAARHVQYVVLVAGDSDFVPAVEEAKAAGVTTVLWCDDDRTVHRDLLACADEVQRFDWAKFPAAPVKRPARGARRAAAPAPADNEVVDAPTPSLAPAVPEDQRAEPTVEGVEGQSTGRRRRRRGGRGRRRPSGDA